MEKLLFNSIPKLSTKKLQSIQFNACLAKTGTIRGISTEKLYEELGWESLKDARWYRKFCTFYKFFKNKSPNYLFTLLLPSNQFYITKSSDKMLLMNIKRHFFKSSYLQSAITKWYKLDVTIRNWQSYEIFKRKI